MKDNNIDFVARYYREDRFDRNAGWHRLGIAYNPKRRWLKVAAAVTLTLVLSTSAAIIYRNYNSSEVAPEIEATTQNINPLIEVRTIDFEEASLTEVVEKIECVYDVKVSNLPEDPTAYKLSLHYEGTPTGLIAEINEILGTKMTIEQK